MSVVNSFIDKLNKLKTEDTVTLKLTSCDKEVQFTRLDVKQQKKLLKHAMDGANGIASCLKELNTIIFDNIVDKTTNLSSIDKYPILISLRKKSLGDKINIEGNTYSLEQLPTYMKLPKSLTLAEVEEHGITVCLELPSLKADTEYLTKIIQEVSKVKENQAVETIAVMYTYEIIKFISKIRFSEGEIDFNLIPINERKTIVDNLPVTLNQQILNFINTVREFENNFITFSDGVVVPINTLFLTGE